MMTLTPLSGYCPNRLTAPSQVIHRQSSLSNYSAPVQFGKRFGFLSVLCLVGLAGGVGVWYGANNPDKNPVTVIQKEKEKMESGDPSLLDHVKNTFRGWFNNTPKDPNP